jgi:DNA-binding FadR family transcriptional regulator
MSTQEQFAPVHPPKTADLVVAGVRDAIRAGDLQPGSRLPAEKALAAHYGISRPTLREALRILEHQELITVRRGARGGAAVRTPGIEPVRRALLDLLLSSGEPEDVELARIVEADADWLMLQLRSAGGHSRRRTRRKAA